ncbi:MAG TPA: hypothetical protein VMM36_13155 [Opitutaceae bacterium]|nr:hypothetical protein [Opitutaceae bacterium]
MIRDGCERLGAALKRVPLVDDYSWSGTDFRFWSARFAIRCESPLCWAVVRRLAYTLNSCVLELWGRKPFVFKPEGEETMWHAKKNEALYWTIESTEPMLDPKEVADHLEMVLLSKIRAEKDWLDY